LLLLPATARGAVGARDFGAVFSPGGRTVAFIHTVGNVGSIDLMARDGSQRRTLLAGVSAQHLAWSPDGSSLAYDDSASIWRVDLATGTQARLTTDDQSKDIESWQPSWSPDGKTIAYSRFQTCFRCTAMLLRGGRCRPHKGRIPAHQAPRVGHLRRRPELLPRPHRLCAHSRVRHRHRRRARHEPTPAYPSLLSRH
jgi:dipeptidyl aminopeptidase/acylaminoacyl peptidase